MASCAESPERHVDRPSSRSQVNAVDWSLCVFCQQKKSKGTTKLMNVSIFDSCKAIEEAARRRSDESMLLKISGVDLIAVEAKYHKHCRSQYVSKSNLMFVDFRVDGEEDVYTQAFQNLREDIKPQLESGVALDMKTLFDSYQGILQHLGCNTAKSYKSERLKRRLQQSFQEEIVFQKLPDPSKPELVYSSSVSLQRMSSIQPLRKVAIWLKCQRLLKINPQTARVRMMSIPYYTTPLKY